MGGKFFLESQLKVGTTVNIYIPKSTAPDWFVPELILKPSDKIVILDDDSTIHQIWDGRFAQSKIYEYDINVFHFSTEDQVQNWLHQNIGSQNIVYLFDFELLGHKDNGLDIIEKLGLKEQAILVTSRFEEKRILEKCQSLGVKLIPKSMAESVPIIFKNQALSTNQIIEQHRDENLFQFDYVYIDDDKYLRRGWEKSAQKHGIKLLTLSSTQDFYQYEKQISKETPIYIDRELGDHEPKGEVFAKELFERGYRQLYLATGHSKSFFPPMDYIVDIIEKDTPWDQSDW